MPKTTISTQQTAFGAAILLIFLGSLISLLAADINHQHTFLQGVTSYDERDYRQALVHFLSLEEQGAVSYELYYNIGNSYYRLGEIGKAILYYKRGVRLQPNDMMLNSNLQYVMSRTKDRQLTDDSNPLIVGVIRIVNAISINGWTVLALILFLLGIVILNLLIIFYRYREKTMLYFLLGLTVALLITTSAIVNYRLSTLNDRSEAVLISSSANAYSGPAADFTLLFAINEGMVFRILESEREWSRIQLPATGIIGWIKNDTFLRVLE